MGIESELPTGGAVVYDANGTLKRGEGNTKTHKRDSTTASEVAFITGGGSGIGLAVASYLLSQGWLVVISDKDAVAGEKATAELGCKFFAADITNYDQLAQAFALTWQQYHRLDFVFANAGIIQKEHYYDEEPLVVSSDGFESPPIPAFLMTAKVNFIGTLQTAYLAQHYLARNGGGSLIFTASSGSLYPSAAVPVYSASKHGVLGFAQSIAKYSLEEKNIRVNSLCPGTIITGLTDEKNWARFPKAHLTPMKKLVDVVGILLDDPTIHGKAVEISGLNHYFHSPRTPVDESMVVAVDRVQSRSFL